jgi:hypothetical protein
MEFSLNFLEFLIFFKELIKKMNKTIQTSVHTQKILFLLLRILKLKNARVYACSPLSSLISESGNICGETIEVFADALIEILQDVTKQKVGADLPSQSTDLKKFIKFLSLLHKKILNLKIFVFIKILHFF